MSKKTLLNKQNKALIYCRVSSERQVNEGNGLGSQEKRCKDYARAKNYTIVKVFPDEGISGGLFERPAMKNLIKYLDSKPSERFIIIFDDLSRFSRDVKVHIQLKAELESRGAKLECLNFNFDDSPESEFAEMVMVAGNQYHRKQNKRQVIQKMKARLEDGFWCFCTPPALKNIPHPEYKKVLNGVIQPYADIFKQAIEKYSYDELNTLEELQDFIIHQYKLNKINKSISLHGVKSILKNPLYAGWLEYKKWGVTSRKGKHEGFISKETFDIVQSKLEGKTKPRLRKDYRLDFSLRSSVLCDSCGQPYTATWSKGKLKYHPYYWCKNKSCPMVWKTIKKSQIDEDFENLLEGTKPTQDLFDLAKAIFTDAWESKKTEGYLLNKSKQEGITEIEHRIKNLIKRASKTDNNRLVDEYEKEIEKLVIEKEKLSNNFTVEEYTDKKLGTMFDKVVSILEEPVTMWKSKNIEERRTILYMYFQEKLRYNRNLGFGTPKLSSAVKLIRSLDVPKNHRVEMPVLKPGPKKHF